jgi:hypothetical protein
MAAACKSNRIVITAQTNSWPPLLICLRMSLTSQIFLAAMWKPCGCTDSQPHSTGKHHRVGKSHSSNQVVARLYVKTRRARLQARGELLCTRTLCFCQSDVFAEGLSWQWHCGTGDRPVCKALSTVVDAFARFLLQSLAQKTHFFPPALTSFTCNSTRFHGMLQLLLLTSIHAPPALSYLSFSSCLCFWTSATSSPVSQPTTE